MKATKSASLTIVIPTIIFSGYTGVELYVYELSKSLVKRGHRVIVLAPEPAGDIVARTRKNGVEVYSFESCPTDIVPDILHLNEPLPSIFALSKWPTTPAIASIHSQFAVEAPFISNRIHSYVCIRPEIISHIKKQYPAISDRCVLLYNGFDFKRFEQHSSHSTTNEKKTILFVGTIDAIRKPSIEHLIKKCADENLNLRVVGKRYESYLDNPPEHVEVLPPRFEVEELFTDDVIATAGVLLGRSTIEGWIAGRPGWIYDIETDGTIKSVELFTVPSDIEKFNIEHVTNELEKLYTAAIASWDSSTYKEYAADSNRMISELMNRSIISGNTIHLLIQKSDYLEMVLSETNQRLEQLAVEMNVLKDETHRAHKKIHRLERYYPHNIHKKLTHTFKSVMKKKDS